MLPEASFHFSVVAELHYILLQQNETANMAGGETPPGGTSSTSQWQKTEIWRGRTSQGLLLGLGARWGRGAVMNQFRKVAAGSGLAHVVGFSLDLNVCLLAGDGCGTVVPCCWSQTTPDSKPRSLTSGECCLISYRLEKPGNDGLHALPARVLAGQEEEMAPWPRPGRVV